jgi:RNA polymerase sigma-70 factor (ECF subfamily)
VTSTGASVTGWKAESGEEPELRSAELEERFAALVVSHRERAVRVAWRLVGGDDAAAEDVAQEAFTRAYKSLASFRDEAKLSTWFYRILVRQAHSYRRWRALRELWTPVAEVEGADRPVAGDPLLRGRIRVALEKLTRKQREAFVLVHMDGFTSREAAAILGMADGTLKSHLHRALGKLRAELADLAGQAGDDDECDEDEKEDRS